MTYLIWVGSFFGGFALLTFDAPLNYFGLPVIVAGALVGYWMDRPDERRRGVGRLTGESKPLNELEPFTEFKWDHDVPELGIVWLRGEGSPGYPTQTWLNGVLLRREPDGEFGWVAETGEPTEMYVFRRFVEMNNDQSTRCSYIEARVDIWTQQANDLNYSEAFRARQAAYAQYGRQKLEALQSRRLHKTLAGGLRRPGPNIVGRVAVD